MPMVEGIHPMKIQSSEELGMVLRAVRKSSGIRQDDLAALVGVSKQFTADVEHGKPTAQIGRVMKLLAHLGLSITLNVPEDALAELERIKAKRARDAATDSPDGKAGA